jgi:hypothetical protein
MGRRLTAEERVRLAPSFSSAIPAIRYFANTSGVETVFGAAGSETPLAWFPVGLSLQSTGGLTWADSAASQVYLLRLEGVATALRLG